MKTILYILFALTIVALGPIATIWSLNTLFPVLNIELGFGTWLAALILGGVVGGSTGFSLKK